MGGQAGLCLSPLSLSPVERQGSFKRETDFRFVFLEVTQKMVVVMVMVAVTPLVTPVM